MTKKDKITCHQLAKNLTKVFTDYGVKISNREIYNQILNLEDDFKFVKITENYFTVSFSPKIYIPFLLSKICIKCSHERFRRNYLTIRYIVNIYYQNPFCLSIINAFTYPVIYSRRRSKICFGDSHRVAKLALGSGDIQSLLLIIKAIARTNQSDD